MKTRTTRTAATKSDKVAEEAQDQSKTLAPSTSNPPTLFILPDNTSPDARIITLPNSAARTPSRYFFCPEKGIYEFTKIATPKQSPSSWLLAPPRTEEHSNGADNAIEDVATTHPPANTTTGATESDLTRGYVIQDANLLVATPLDPLFVLLPALIPKAGETRQLFLSIDDHLDALAENSKHLRHLIRSDLLRRTFKRRAQAVCDNVDAGDEKMYRLSHDKLLAELQKKANRMAANGLPASLEEHFVQEPLKLPMMAILTEESMQTWQPENDDSSTPVLDSQSTAESTTTPPLKTQDSNVSVLTEATSVEANPGAREASAPEEIIRLLRLRTALNFIFSSYLPAELRRTLNTTLSSPESPTNFQPLDAHLEKIASLKREQQALRSLSDNISRKRSGFDDEGAEEARQAKRLKKEEEEKAKKNVSRGVKALAKADTSGMKKLSSFFTKAPAKKK
ncbi:hypothetical protein AAFC00_001469 [Neodothiora populina]|uniref:Ribonuclease H2 subunit B n=1 Tax=Neodothiora populina TaxID=2781224 RepID=A0ABR3PNZ2_9PEZI